MGYRRRHWPSRVTPAQQTVSPCRRLGRGTAFTKMTASSSDVLICFVRLFDVEVLNIQLMIESKQSRNYRTMTGFRVAFVTQQTTAMLAGHLCNIRERLACTFGPQVLTVDFAECAEASLPRRLAAGLRVAEGRHSDIAYTAAIQRLS